MYDVMTVLSHGGDNIIAIKKNKGSMLRQNKKPMMLRSFETPILLLLSIH